LRGQFLLQVTFSIQLRSIDEALTVLISRVQNYAISGNNIPIFELNYIAYFEIGSNHFFRLEFVITLSIHLSYLLIINLFIAFPPPEICDTLKYHSQNDDNQNWYQPFLRLCNLYFFDSLQTTLNEEESIDHALQLLEKGKRYESNH